MNKITTTIILIALMLLTVAFAIWNMLDRGGWLSILVLVTGSCALLIQIVSLIVQLKNNKK